MAENTTQGIHDVQIIQHDAFPGNNERTGLALVRYRLGLSANYAVLSYSSSDFDENNSLLFSDARILSASWRELDSDVMAIIHLQSRKLQFLNEYWFRTTYRGPNNHGLVAFRKKDFDTQESMETALHNLLRSDDANEDAMAIAFEEIAGCFQKSLTELESFNQAGTEDWYSIKICLEYFQSWPLLTSNDAYNLGVLSEQRNCRVQFEEEALAGLRSIDREKKAGKAGGRASENAKHMNLECLMSELEALADLFPRMNETAIFEQAYANAIGKRNMPKSRRTIEEYGTILRSDPQFRSRYYDIFGEIA